ncbi:unnamed protein product, partial [Didymodactylos carnosus]
MVVRDNVCKTEMKIVKRLLLSFLSSSAYALENNQCSEEEYRCQNGQCIPKEFRNDMFLNPDCQDGTDEGYRFYQTKCSKDPAFRCEERSCEIRIDCGKTPRKKRQPGADGFCDECLSSVLDSKVQLSMTTLTASQHPTMISTDTKDNDTIGYYPDT